MNNITSKIFLIDQNNFYIFKFLKVIYFGKKIEFLVVFKCMKKKLSS